MIGQQSLLEDIWKLIENDLFPRFSIVVGERGAEHEDVAHYVANKMGADYIRLQDVKVDTVRQMISRAYTLHETTVYCIPHADDMSANAKNALLKVTEEAPNKAYIIMCLEDLSSTLETIKSRAAIFRMNRCTPSQIEEFCRSLFVDSVNNEVVKIAGEICSTPGEVCMLTKMGAIEFYRYVEWIADNIFTMNGAEVFTLWDKLSLKEGDDKWDVLLFLRAFQTIIMKQVCSMVTESNTDEKCCLCEIVRATGHYMQDLRIKGVNRAMLLDTWALQVRKIWKSMK